MNLSSENTYPLKQVDKVLIEGVKEIVGPDTVRDLFTRTRSLSAGQSTQPAQAAKPPITLDNLQHALNERYGSLGGQGVALRSGRAAFRRGLQVWGGEVGVLSNEYRLLPFPRRVRAGLEKICGLLTQECQSHCQVSEDDRHWYVSLGNFLTCTERSEHPACYLVIGLLQEYMAWTAGGRFFHVSETDCTSRGAQACLFKIDKSSLE